MTPLLVSDLPRNVRRKALTAYVVACIQNPDPESRFERATRSMRWIPAALLIPIMVVRGYDGLLFLDKNEDLVGHIFFQRHGDAIHAFSLAVVTQDQSTRTVTEMMRALLAYAWEQPHVAKIHLGTAVTLTRTMRNARDVRKARSKARSPAIVPA